MSVRNHLLSVVAITALVALAGAAKAQTPASDDRVNVLQSEVQRLRSDIDVIKGNIEKIVQYLKQTQTLQPTPGDQTAGLNIAGAPVLGRKDAPVTIIEFSDFECPFCQNFFALTLPQLKREYIDTGKVRYIRMDFPLDRVHRKARKAAEAAHCADEQGKFWEMHDILFAQKGQLDVSQYGGYAKTLGLNTSNFDSCLASGRHAAKIDRSMANAALIGIRVTPSFIVSLTEAGNIVNGGAVITGAQTFAEYRNAIEQALAVKAQEAPARN